MISSYIPARPEVRKAWKSPVRVRPRDAVVVILLVLASVAALTWAWPVLFAHAANVDVARSVAISLIPLAFTLVFVWVIDSWEPEPGALYFVALTWGGGAAVFGALFLNAWSKGIAPLFLPQGAGEFEVTAWVASYGAPLSEELIKGLGVMIIFVAFSRAFNGPADGIVYGALIGAGFAFTENVLYFTEYAATLSNTFQVRFLDSPLSHDAYTAFFGFFLGFAEYSRRRIMMGVWAIPGLVGAWVFHFLNNNALGWHGMTYGMYKLLNTVPIALIAVVMVLYAHREEKESVRSGLAPFVESGQIAATELAFTMTLAERRRSKEWAAKRAQAKGYSADSGAAAMRQMHRELLKLGHLRARAIRRGTESRRSVQLAQAEHLAHIQKLREVFI
ncbi:RsiW-degrading membrane proteinase PrsW (M82 family) [Arcanobacterium wilhelmae]|uniref:RsiW-degrading membrane proteinase PrsW (M82 family) n=1 Tax=Arcanobacterium wilhelmae TaxID=1803177 RepID=A0ABT9N8N9_9ACTO|nr:PrsW family intramembrane metalloprotease [Arcanobacterium wilhelmae]MDP9800068.1 RsiW-degrading membrane proteinase PrsW (M82 family) [Arcanobacterium wilhelmae]WFN89563.1 PrsW family intramembrane metalloprotease [Arcanobacterium wilhelmae]